MLREQVNLNPTTTPPPEIIFSNIEKKGAKLGNYSANEYYHYTEKQKEILEQENDPKIKTAGLNFIKTVDDIRKLSSILSQNSSNLDKNQAITACRTYNEVMFTADALSFNPEKLEAFWNKIYFPLMKKSGLSDQSLELLTNSFMSEMAIGKSLSQLLTDKNPNLGVFKSSPEEDATKKRDLVIGDKNIKYPKFEEKYLQIKLYRGGYHDFSELKEGADNNFYELIIYYNNDESLEKLFNTRTGQPYDNLTNKIRPQLNKILNN